MDKFVVIYMGCPYIVKAENFKGAITQFWKNPEDVSSITRLPNIEQGWVSVDSAHEKCSQCGKIFTIDSLLSVGNGEEPSFCPACGNNQTEEL